MKKFKHTESGTFKYWFSHWLSFQKTAIKHKCWRLRFITHDIEKPILKLFIDYEKVKKIHQKYNRHHLKIKNNEIDVNYKYDFLGMVIDWECSKLTKLDGQLNAREFLGKLCIDFPSSSEYLKININPILDKYDF